MLAGATITGAFASLYYYFYSIFNTTFSKIFSHLHLLYYSGGVWLTFLPMFYLGFSGLPRRVHDFPAIFMGWQGTATCGHMLSMVGVVFFFITLLEAAIENSSFLAPGLGLSRWQKRVHYYFFKIKHNRCVDLMFSSIPRASVRLKIVDEAFGEFEIFSYR